MRIIVSNREKLFADINKTQKENPQSYIISICVTDPKSKSVNIPLDESKIIRLSFHDVEDNYPGSEPHIFKFNNELAKEIVSFISFFFFADLIIFVSCEAGVSRSPAIAAAIALKYISEDVCQTFFKRYIPNRTVFRIMCEEFQIEQPKVLHSHEINSHSFLNFFSDDNEG